MARARVTEQDPRLPHQISLLFKSGEPTITRVFCNCRLEPLGEVQTGSGDPWPIYNDPNNHCGEFVPQSTAKVYDVK